METTMGYVGWIGTFEGKKKDGNESIIESELVRELRLLGAIPVGKVRAYSAYSALSILYFCPILIWRIDNLDAKSMGELYCLDNVSWH